MMEKENKKVLMNPSQKAYLLQRNDGTSMGSRPTIVGIALTEEDAKIWKSQEPEGSWHHRRYFPVDIYEGE